MGRDSDSTSRSERQERDNDEQIADNHCALLRKEHKMRQTKRCSQNNHRLTFQQQRDNSHQREPDDGQRNRPKVGKSLERKVDRPLDEVRNAWMHAVSIPASAIDLSLYCELI